MNILLPLTYRHLSLHVTNPLSWVQLWFYLVTDAAQYWVFPFLLWWALLPSLYCSVSFPHSLVLFSIYSLTSSVLLQNDWAFLLTKQEKVSLLWSHIKLCTVKIVNVQSYCIIQSYVTIVNIITNYVTFCLLAALIKWLQFLFSTQGYIHSVKLCSF